MVIYTENDILKTVFQDTVICQSVNCRGVMGRGLAQAIRTKFPQVYDVYRSDFAEGVLTLGYVSYISCNNTNFIANICGQEGYGTDKQYTDYDALEVGFEDVKAFALANGCKVAIPYGIGSGLGGGSWERISTIIEEIFGDNEVICMICRKRESGETIGKDKTKKEETTTGALQPF
jgi:O-acetyl-ADP-ribose deacetylase (regulator of RNase III)